MGNQSKANNNSSSSTGLAPVEADPNSEARIRKFEAAVANGQSEEVKAYYGIPKFDPNRTLTGVPPLHRAIINHDERMVKTLYSFRRLEKNIKNSQGQTALELAEALKGSEGSEEAAAVHAYVAYQVHNWERLSSSVSIK